MARMEDGSLNLCYLSKKEVLNKYGGIDALESEALSQNPFIKEVLGSSRKLLNKPIVISNIFFEEKKSRGRPHSYVRRCRGNDLSPGWKWDGYEHSRGKNPGGIDCLV